jgi:hypothetical protein
MDDKDKKNLPVIFDPEEKPLVKTKEKFASYEEEELQFEVITSEMQIEGDPADEILFDLTGAERAKYEKYRWKAFRKIERMLRNLDWLLLRRIMSEEQIRQRQSLRIAVGSVLLVVLLFGSITGFGVYKFVEDYNSAHFYLKSAWVNPEGNVRVIVKAINLTDLERVAKFESINARIYNSALAEWTETMIMPVYLKSGDMLLNIQSIGPMALPGVCNLKVHITRKDSFDRTVQVKKLIAEGSLASASGVKAG